MLAYYSPVLTYRLINYVLSMKLNNGLFQWQR